MKNFARATAFALLAAVVFPAFGDESKNDSSLLLRLRSAKPEVRMQAGDEIADSRREIIRGLIAAIEIKEQYGLFDTTTVAIDALGELRAIEAVDILGDLITLQLPLLNFEEPRESEKFRAAVALVSIGLPSIPKMIQNISWTPDEQKRKLSAWVIREVLGTRLAKIKLEAEAHIATDDVARRRIEDAIRDIDESTTEQMR